MVSAPSHADSITPKPRSILFIFLTSYCCKIPRLARGVATRIIHELRPIGASTRSINTEQFKSAEENGTFIELPKTSRVRTDRNGYRQDKFR